MTSSAEYMAKAIAFDCLANTAPDPVWKKRYAGLAECYRLLANEPMQVGQQPDQQQQTH
jgi:hypothetical protein